MNDVVGYRRPYFETQPDYLYPPYRSTIKRSPTKPLVLLPHTLSEVTGPVFGFDDVKPGHSDLTHQHAGDPLGERIVVSGRLLDENSHPVANALIELWQANAAGRYRHAVDDHDAARSQLHWLWPALTDARGNYRFITIKPERTRGATTTTPGARRICISIFGIGLVQRLVTQMYFPGDPAASYDPMYNSVPDEKARRLISRFDWERTIPDIALAFRFEIVPRPRRNGDGDRRS
jgi:protocatechuate 3,4-dioxygenase beta subunit